MKVWLGMKIENIDIRNLNVFPWRTTNILTPDYKGVRLSMRSYGCVTPLLVQASTGGIIDGVVRWSIAATDKEYTNKYGLKLPVHYIECDEITAKLLHVQLNRFKGFPVARYLSMLIVDLVETDMIEPRFLADMLVMTPDEFTTLMNPRLIKTIKTAEHQYSKAWIPVEHPNENATQIASSEMFFERPPNPDR
jgi:hypothetical protein